jgi:hypothetical protein
MVPIAALVAAKLGQDSVPGEGNGYSYGRSRANANGVPRKGISPSFALLLLLLLGIELRPEWP